MMEDVVGMEEENKRELELDLKRRGHESPLGLYIVPSFFFSFPLGKWTDIVPSRIQLIFSLDLHSRTRKERTACGTGRAGTSIWTSQFHS